LLVANTRLLLVTKYDWLSVSTSVEVVVTC
jgi:hypothetical protein